MRLLRNTYLCYQWHGTHKHETLPWHFKHKSLVHSVQGIVKHEKDKLEQSQPHAKQRYS